MMILFIHASADLGGRNGVVSVVSGWGGRGVEGKGGGVQGSGWGSGLRVHWNRAFESSENGRGESRLNMERTREMQRSTERSGFTLRRRLTGRRI